MAKVNIPCIPSNVVEQIKKENLNVSSEERAKILSKYLLPEDALNFSKLFERAKTLKNQELAFKRLMDDVQGLSAEKKARLSENARLELQRKREMMYNSDGSINENFDALLSHSETEWEQHTKKMFEAKYDIEIPEEKLAQITALRKEVDSYPVGSEEWGASRVKLAGAIDEVKNPTNSMGFLKTIGYNAKSTASDFSKAEGFFPKAGVALKTVGQIIGSPAYRALKASVDASFAFNQGYKILLDSPKNWGESLYKGLASMKGLGKQEVMDAFHVKLMSDPMFDDAVKNGLKIGGLEEYFENTLFSKIPILKTLIKTSDNAFTIFVQNARFNIYKGQMEAMKASQEILKLTGKELKDKELDKALKAIADTANSISGSGSFGKAESAINGLNSTFFAPRYTKSAIDTLWLPIKPGAMNKVARIRSAKLLGKYVASFLMIGGGISAVAPDRIQMNPLSPQFGKVRVSDTKWIPFGGPIPSYISTITRLARGKTMTSSGTIKELNTGKFGSTTREDITMNFAKNKLAPMPSIISQAWWTGKNYMGEPFDVKDIPDQLLTPISPGNIFELMQTNPTDMEALFLGLGEMGGLSSTDYGNNKTQGPIRKLLGK